MLRKIFFRLLPVLLISLSNAKDIVVVCPYAGLMSNEVYSAHKGRELSLNDTAFLAGLFAQWLRPSEFQANTFLFHAPEINYGSVWGLHLMADRYFYKTKHGSGVAGCGAEILSIDMDADTHSMPVPGGGRTAFRDFELKNTVFTPFVRAGYKVSFERRPFRISFFPWAGVQYQRVRGRVEIDFPAFLFPAHSEIKGDDHYAMAGAGLNADLFRFIMLEGKYHSTFNAGYNYPTVSAMANIFLNRRMGVSCRYKRMEMPSGSNTYWLAGLAFLLK